MAFRTSYAGAAAQLDAFRVLADGGQARFYDGTMPAECETAEDGTILLRFVLQTPDAWGAATDQNPGAQSVLNVATAAVNAEAGNETLVTYCRVYSSGGACIFQDDDIGDAVSGARIKLSDTTVTSGQEYSITSWTLNQKESDVDVLIY